jgi:transposase
MAKYSEKQKLEVVTAYLSGSLGLKATAKAHEVGVDSLRGWAARYRATGIAGIQAKRRSEYDTEFKLQVLQRMKEDGLSCREAGALFNVRRFDVIAAWERAYQASGLAGLASAREVKKAVNSRAETVEDSIEASQDAERSRQELLLEIQQLRMENAYLKKLDALVRDQVRSAQKNGRGS